MPPAGEVRLPRRIRAPQPQPPLSTEETKILVALAEPDDDEEVEELRDDFEGLEIERIGNTSFFVLTIPAGVDVTRFVAAEKHKEIEASRAKQRKGV